MHGADKEQDGSQGRGLAVIQAPAGGGQIAGHDQAVAVALRMGLEKIGGHHGGQQTRHHERGDHRHRGGDAELDEEFARHPAHEGRRQEYCHQGQGRGDDRKPDLVRRLHGRLEGGLTHAQVANNVLDLDDGVVHQDAHHQGQGQQGQDVETEPQPQHGREGRDDGERQGHGGDQGRAPVPQEPEDHQDREECPLVEQFHGPLVIVQDRIDEVEGLLDADVGMQGLQAFYRRLDGLGDRHLAGPPDTGHLEGHHRRPVQQGAGAAFREGIGNRTQIPQAHPPPIRERDDQLRDVPHGIHGAQAADRLHGPADIPAPARGILLDPLQLGGDGLGGHPEGLHAGAVEIHVDLPVHPPDPGHLTHALDRQQGLGDLVVHEPGQGLLVHTLRGHRVGHDG